MIIYCTLPTPVVYYACPVCVVYRIINAPLSCAQTLYSVARHEGVLALWRGAVPAIFKTVPATAITFGVLPTPLNLKTVGVF